MVLSTPLEGEDTAEVAEAAAGPRLDALVGSLIHAVLNQAPSPSATSARPPQVGLLVYLEDLCLTRL